MDRQPFGSAITSIAVMRSSSIVSRNAERTLPPGLGGRARHHDQTALAALVLHATTNFFNHMNAPIGQDTGAW